jgi:hypothetical protein
MFVRHPVTKKWLWKAKPTTIEEKLKEQRRINAKKSSASKTPAHDVTPSVIPEAKTTWSH